MSTIEFAQSELERAGMFDKDADYGGTLAKAVMDLIEVFATQGHTGMTAPLTIHLFSKLAMQEPITPLSYAEDEWVDRSDVSGYPLWQNVRDSRIFSQDLGKTYWSVE